IVLEVLDERAGLGPFIEGLGLAVIDFPPTVHMLCLSQCGGGIAGSHAPETALFASLFACSAAPRHGARSGPRAILLNSRPVHDTFGRSVERVEARAAPV